MFVVGIDGCRVGWVGFKVDVASMSTLVELIDLVWSKKLERLEIAQLRILHRLPFRMGFSDLETAPTISRFTKSRLQGNLFLYRKPRPIPAS